MAELPDNDGARAEKALVDAVRELLELLGRRRVSLNDLPYLWKRVYWEGSEAIE